MVEAPRWHSGVWVCYVWGMKFVSYRRFGLRKGIQIYDFCELTQRMHAIHPSEDLDREDEGFVPDTALVQKRTIFENDVTSTLLYRVCTFFPPIEGNFDAVMVSEDALITVASVSEVILRQKSAAHVCIPQQHSSRQYCIMTL